MQSSRLWGPSIAGLLYLMGCSGGDAGTAAVQPFDGTASAQPSSTAANPTNPAAPSGPSSAGDASAAIMPMPSPSGRESADSNLGLLPSPSPQPAEDASATRPPTEALPTDSPPAAPTDGNGRLVGNDCMLVCFNDLTDSDANGNTDGWGFESGRSCITPESDLALSSPPCDIPELLPLPALPPQLPTGSVPRPASNRSTGFFVANGRLFDANGNDVILRGINHPVAWFQGDALEWMDQIATTGSNSVRIVWETTQRSTQILQQSIQRAIDLAMVPMVELHDVTGSSDVNGPMRMAQYYASQAGLLRSFEPYLLLNIANEWGEFDTPDEDWVQAYGQAIAVLRNAGLNHTLVIDANDNGQRGSTIIAKGAGLLAADPQHNLLFSTHMYEEYANPQTILDVIRGAQLAQLPLIVGEFGFQRASGTAAPIPVPYDAMIAEAERVGVGYLAWSWTGNSQDVGYLDLSVDGSAGNLTDWGNAIINGPNGIRTTSQTASVFTLP